MTPDGKLLITPKYEPGGFPDGADMIVFEVKGK
jgi:hypothetical protein